jgi:hypothetical protein
MLCITKISDERLNGQKNLQTKPVQKRGRATPPAYSYHETKNRFKNLLFINTRRSPDNPTEIDMIFSGRGIVHARTRRIIPPAPNSNINSTSTP